MFWLSVFLASFLIANIGYVSFCYIRNHSWKKILVGMSWISFVFAIIAIGFWETSLKGNITIIFSIISFFEEIMSWIVKE